MEIYKIGSRERPITNYVNTKEIGPVPLVDIPMMSDYKWQRKALQSRLENPEWYRAILGKDVERLFANTRRPLDCLRCPQYLTRPVLHRAGEPLDFCRVIG